MKRRLNNKILQEDITVFEALQAIPNYNPSDKNFDLAKTTAANQLVTQKQTDETQKKAAADAASDDATDAERDFHNIILGVKTQVKAQFGVNSNEYQSLGLKKKEEYKRPGGRKPSDGTK